MRIPSGKTDIAIYFVAVDATDYVTREPGLASFTVYRSRDGAAEAQYTTPTITEIDATNMPGVYALLVDEDTTIESTSDSEEYCVHITHAGMAPVTRTIELYRRSVTSGQTIDVSSGGVEVGTFQAGAITAAAIATDAIDADALADGAITAATFAAGAITATVIATDAIDADAVADGAITSGVFASGAITADAIAANAIGSSEIADGAITSAKFAAGAITATVIATDAIDADAIAANAIDASALAADAAAEIADAVWDEDATGHQTGGTFGQAIGDPGADTTTIYQSIVTDAAGTNVAADIIAIKAQTAAIETDTAEIGAAGAGLTNINLPNQTMDIVGNITGNLSGSVGSVTGAVGSVTGNVGGNVTGTIGGLTAAALKDFFDTDSTAVYGDAVAGSVVKEIADNAGGASLTVEDIAAEVWTTAARTLTAIDEDATTLDLDATIRGAVGLAAANLDTQIGDLPTNAELTTALGTADDAVLAQVALVKAKTDSLTFTVAGSVDANIQHVNDVQVTGDGQVGTEWGPA